MAKTFLTHRLTTFLAVMAASFSPRPSLAQDLPINENINFSKLKDVLKKDKLSDIVENKLKIEKKVQAEIVAKTQEKNLFPESSDFWRIMSELWLLDQVSVLKWDFERPDYGLDESVKSLFKKLGLVEKRVRLLLINSQVLTHAVLPGEPDGHIVLLSVPFMRGMDLNKNEIALLAVEDFLRLEVNKFDHYLGLDDKAKQELSLLYGKKISNFDQIKKVKTEIQNKISQLYFKKGFSFENQFSLTKKMSDMLKSLPDYWNSYYQLYLKIDRLTKENKAFESHIKIYPSPEMQLKWLAPKTSGI